MKRTVRTLILLEINSLLNQENPVSIDSHWFETKLPDLVLRKYNILHSPGTYSRAWRDIREQGSFWNIFDIQEEQYPGRKEKTYIIKRIPKAVAI